MVEDESDVEGLDSILNEWRAKNKSKSFIHFGKRDIKWGLGEMDYFLIKDSYGGMEMN